MAASSSFLRDQVKIDVRKRAVFLPKVCDVYRNDFGMGDGRVCLSLVLKYLDDGDQLRIEQLLESGVMSVKFRPAQERFRTNLTILHAEDSKCEQEVE